MHKENLDGGLPFHVMLAYAPLGLVRATARQLRHDGMTVDTGMITLDEQAEVELSFSHHQHDQLISHHIRARVSASSRGTAVLTFSDYARSTHEVLRKLLASAAGSPASHQLRYLRTPAHPPHLPPSGRLA